jgi:hypothetical protein
VNKYWFITYPDEGFDRRTTPLGSEIRKSLNGFSFKEASMSQNFRSSDTSLPTSAVNSDLFQQ